MIWATAGAAILAAVGAAYWNLSPNGSATDSKAKVEQSTSTGDLTLLVSGDTAGWIVPCGCASNQSGGLLRRGTIVAEARKLGEVLVADAGGAPAGTSLYERLKFEAILRGEKELGVCAHNLGGPELALGAKYLQETAGRLGIEFLSVNARTTDGQLIGADARIVSAAGRRLLLIGVVSQQYRANGIAISEPREAVLSVLSKESSNFDAAIVLAYLPEDELREMAAALPEVHAVIGGPTGQSIAPVRIGPVWLASATNKGKFLSRFQLKGDARANDWQGDVIEVTGRFADDAAQSENLRAFREELSQRDVAAEDSGLMATRLDDYPADFQVAGSESCRQCHATEFDGWHGTGHAHAWKTLVEAAAEMDSYCQQCHTTGFGLPDGFASAKRSSGRVDVGCESCHGPSGAHMQDTATKTPFAARDQCVRCHDRENSPQFEWAAYWPRIQHGVDRSNAGQNNDK